MSRYVLVVDDEASIRDLLRAFLEEEGYAVVLARHGREALDRIAADRPALVISDVNMPVMSGSELRDALRATQPGVPIVLMSAGRSVGPDIAGGDGYVGKPFDLVELLRLVERFASPWSTAGREESPAPDRAA